VLIPSLRVQRIADRDLAAVEEDGSGIRAHRPTQDLHQRGLAGAVLSQEDVLLQRMSRSAC
jgi:hypothetical protein